MRLDLWARRRPYGRTIKGELELIAHRAKWRWRIARLSSSHWTEAVWRFVVGA